MPEDRNTLAARRFFDEVLGMRNLSAMQDLLAPHFVLHYPTIAGPIYGPAAFRYSLTVFRAAFPDLQITIEEEIAAGDAVVCRFTFGGTHRGDYLGVPATGRRVSWTGISIFHLADGVIEEVWVEFDALGLQQQLATPALDQAIRP